MLRHCRLAAVRTKYYYMDVISKISLRKIVSFHDYMHVISNISLWKRALFHYYMHMKYITFAFVRVFFYYYMHVICNLSLVQLNLLQPAWRLHSAKIFVSGSCLSARPI